MQAVTLSSFPMSGTLLREAACNLRRELVSGVGIEDRKMSGYIPRPIESRFWPKVDKSMGPDNCWPWIGDKWKSGYGRFFLHKKSARNPSRKVVAAHRQSYALTHGPIPAGFHVLHRCDNPPCCNPSHLFLGTDADNVADCIKKGRRANQGGETNGRTTLRNSDILEIRRELTLGVSVKVLSQKYGLCLSSIYNIRHGRTWTR